MRRVERGRANCKASPTSLICVFRFRRAAALEATGAGREGYWTIVDGVMK